MGYNDLSECTLTAAERVEEAQRIVNILSDALDDMKSNERDFVEKMDGTDYCWVKQLFWLRDIKGKYVD